MQDVSSESKATHLRSQVTFRLAYHEHEELRAVADRLGLSTGQLIRAAVRRRLAEAEEEATTTA
jgi:hypothetical protein